MSEMVATQLPDFTAGRTNRVPLEFRDEDKQPIDLSGKTLRIRYWIAETNEFVYEDSLSDGDESGDVEFVHSLDAFSFSQRTRMGWILDLLEGETEDPQAKGFVECDPVPPEPPGSEES